MTTFTGKTITEEQARQFRVSIEGCLPDLLDGCEGEEDERYLDPATVRDYVADRTVDTFPNMREAERANLIDYVTKYYCGEES